MNYGKNTFYTFTWKVVVVKNDDARCFQALVVNEESKDCRIVMEYPYDGGYRLEDVLEAVRKHAGVFIDDCLKDGVISL